MDKNNCMALYGIYSIVSNIAWHSIAYILIFMTNELNNELNNLEPIRCPHCSSHLASFMNRDFFMKVPH